MISDRRGPGGSGTTTGEHTPPSGQRRPAGALHAGADGFGSADSAGSAGLPSLSGPPGRVTSAGSAGRYTMAGPISDWGLPSLAPTLAVRVCATVALLAVVGTFVAAQIDFLRRHKPGITPARYVLPQLWQVWLPGLGVALLFAGLAFFLHRSATRQRAGNRPSDSRG